MQSSGPSQIALIVFAEDRLRSSTVLTLQCHDSHVSVKVIDFWNKCPSTGLTREETWCRKAGTVESSKKIKFWIHISSLLLSFVALT